MDPLRRSTNKTLKQVEKELRKEYKQAQDELSRKLQDHLDAYKIKDATKRRQLKEGKISLKEYQQWRAGQMATGRRWEEMRNQIAKDLANVNEIAKSIVNGYVPDVYATAHNYGTYEVEHGLNVDTSYTLYDAQTIERIIRENPELLPPPGKKLMDDIAKGKAVKWEEGQVQSAIMQAILQGESVPDIARRMALMLGIKDFKAAMRYARTAINAAENAGKLDSYFRAQSMGIELEKTWSATMDDRTRDAHRELDNQTVPLNEPFVNEIGEIMYPGDPDAAAENTWNCRCSMVTQLKGFRRDLSDLKLRNTSKMGDMSYNEWKEAHGKSQDILEPVKVANMMKMRYRRDYRR